jgi:2-dehydro-3-deoxygluconokinase
MNARVVTFGEIMLRLKAPGHERFFQFPAFESTFGGGEANVAVSLANFGLDAAFVTALPDNDIAKTCVRELRGFGVDISHYSIWRRMAGHLLSGDGGQPKAVQCGV